LNTFTDNLLLKKLLVNYIKFTVGGFRYLLPYEDEHFKRKVLIRLRKFGAPEVNQGNKL
jgi:hypothetical protein